MKHSDDEHGPLRHRELRSDEELVAGFCAGDLTAFDVLFNRHRAVVIRSLSRLCHDPTEAEDLAQETFLRIALHVGGSASPCFRAWLDRVVRNVAIDYIRSRSRHSVSSLDDPRIAMRATLGLVADPAEVVERQEQLRLVGLALQRLSVHHRRALLMVQFAGFDHGRVADRLGVSPGAAHKLVARARKALQSECQRLGRPT